MESKQCYLNRLIQRTTCKSLTAHTQYMNVGTTSKMRNLKRFEMLSVVTLDIDKVS